MLARFPLLIHAGGPNWALSRSNVLLQTIDLARENGTTPLVDNTPISTLHLAHVELRVEGHFVPHCWNRRCKRVSFPKLAHRQARPRSVASCPDRQLRRNGELYD